MERKQMIGILSSALKAVKADQIEVGLYDYEDATTRFANSMIHQNMLRQDNYFWTRVILDKKIGASSFRIQTKEDVIKAMETAYELAQYQREDPEFVSLPKPTTKRLQRFQKRVKRSSPTERARAVERMVKICKKNGLEAAGIVNTFTYRLGVFNSLGIRSIGETSGTNVTITAISKNSSGFAEGYSPDFSKIDFNGLALKASQKALLSRNPIEIEPGHHTVLLEEPAVAEILWFLGYLGFGARAFQEGTSFVSSKLGKQITGRKISISDDVYDRRSVGLAIDFEGVKKKRVALIKKGVAKGVVYDSFYAHKEHKRSTGHALPAPNPFGPFPRDLVMEGGKVSKHKMLSSMKKGILVTRFWYTRVVDPDKPIITGMTRDGTFLIENGRLVKGIKNLRYTINVLETFKNIVMMSRPRLTGGNYNKVVPALLIKDFNFSGKTEF